MGWFSSYFDQDFHGDHKEGDEYTANIEFEPHGPHLYGTFTLSVYRVRNGKMGKTPLLVSVKGVNNYGGKRQVERELERESDEFVRSQTGVHDS